MDSRVVVRSFEEFKAMILKSGPASIWDNNQVVRLCSPGDGRDTVVLVPRGVVPNSPLPSGVDIFGVYTGNDCATLVTNRPHLLALMLVESFSPEQRAVTYSKVNPVTPKCVNWHIFHHNDNPLKRAGILWLEGMERPLLEFDLHGQASATELATNRIIHVREMPLPE